MLRRPKNLIKRLDSGEQPNHKEFFEIVKILNTVAEHTIKTIPVLVFSDNGLLIASNSIMQIEATFDHGLPYAAVSINKIVEIFNYVNSEVKFIHQADKIKIKSGKFSSILPIIDQEVNLLPMNRSESWENLPSNFSNAIDCCSISISKISGLNWVLNNYNLTEKSMITSDQSRGSVYQFNSKMVIPDKNFNISPDLAKLIQTIKPDRYKLIENKFVEFISDKFYIKSALPTEDYPDIIDKIFIAEQPIQINRVELINAVEKAKIFSSIDFNSTRDGNISLDFQNNILIISSQNSYGSVTEKIMIKSKNFREEKFCNPFFLLDILKLIKTDNLTFYIGKDRIVFEYENLKHVIALRE